MIHSYYLPILDIAHSERKEKGEATSALRILTLTVYNVASGAIFLIFLSPLERSNTWRRQVPSGEGKGTTNGFGQGVAAPLPSPDRGWNKPHAMP